MTNIPDDKVLSCTANTQRRTEMTGNDKQQKAQTDLWDMPLPETANNEAQGGSKDWWDEEQ